MTSEKLEETSKLTYDDRRKELLQIKSQITENKSDPVEVEGKIDEPKMLSVVEQKMEVKYSEEGIKLAYKNLSKQKTSMEKRVADMKEQIEAIKDLPEELQKLQENMSTIANHIKASQAKLSYEGLKEELKEVNKEITELKDAVGTRLKL